MSVDPLKPGSRGKEGRNQEKDSPGREFSDKATPPQTDPNALRADTRRRAPQEIAQCGMATSRKSPPSSAAEGVDTRYLETLMGYNARRAALAIIEVFMERMSVYGLKVVDFSVLSLVAHNPGITSRQLCANLDILPPNLVGIIASMDRRGLIERRPHPSDGRAVGLHLTPSGLTMMKDAEQTAADLEIEATSRLSPAERKTLIRLLQKIYL